MKEQEAQEYCRNLGGWLAEIHDQDTFDLLQHHGKKLKIRGGDWWLGASDQEEVRNLKKKILSYYACTSKVLEYRLVLSERFHLKNIHHHCPLDRSAVHSYRGDNGNEVYL